MTEQDRSMITILAKTRWHWHNQRAKTMRHEITLMPLRHWTQFGHSTKTKMAATAV